MRKSESKDTGKRAGRKPKFDYASEEFLSIVETYAKKGFTDREIAFALGMNPNYFCEVKGSTPVLSEVLARGRATITAAVRAKFLAMAVGGIKTKSVTKRKLKDINGDYTDEEEIQTIESELAPSLQAMSVWLYHHDEEWRKVERKQDDEEDIPTDIEQGIDIDSWIKKQVK